MCIRDRGLTQTKVAKAINVTFQQIQKYEKGTNGCLLYTSDAADEGLGVDLGGRRIIKKKDIF